MKAILIIDMPINCNECRFYDFNQCNAEMEIIEDEYLEDISIHHAVRVSVKPNWCPLKPLPERKNEHYVGNENWELESIINAEHRGWNDCVDEILGGEEE